ncbi:hypothetical protein B0T21DRAFT_190727 [Apiosordaria backusii]|uniref:Uncharacterized protein n=1 Tax=Apiosordaria backusii TaxID=314023 RepID=A0AA40BK89_9PEZI|nr:hypothetical protein B0T21DRAFT_190727 [Apiosordaria backusii]
MTISWPTFHSDIGGTRCPDEHSPPALQSLSPLVRLTWHVQLNARKVCRAWVPVVYRCCEGCISCKLHWVGNLDEDGLPTPTLTDVRMPALPLLMVRLWTSLASPGLWAAVGSQWIRPPRCPVEGPLQRGHSRRFPDRDTDLCCLMTGWIVETFSGSRASASRGATVPQRGMCILVACVSASCRKEPAAFLRLLDSKH